MWFMEPDNILKNNSTYLSLASVRVTIIMRRLPTFIMNVTGSGYVKSMTFGVDDYY